MHRGTDEARPVPTLSEMRRALVPGPIVRRIVPSPFDSLVLTTFFLSLMLPIYTETLGWRLITGKWSLQNLDVPRVNLFAFSAPGHPWVEHEWLSDVIFYLTLARLGPGAGLMLRGLVLSMTVGIVYLILRRRGGVVPAVVLALWVMATLLLRLRFEPMMFPVLLLACCLLLLEHPTWRWGRSLIGLPIVFFAWANLHASFLVGLVLVAAHGLGEMQDFGRRRGDRSFILHLGAGGLGLLFCFWNPYYSQLFAMGLEDFWQLVVSMPLRLQLLSWSYLFLAAFTVLGVWFIVTVAGREIRWRLVFPLLWLTPLAFLVPNVIGLWVIWAAVTVMEHIQQLAERIQHERRGYLEKVGGVSSWLRTVADRFAMFSMFDRHLMRGPLLALGLTIALAYLSIPPGTHLEIAGRQIQGLELQHLIAEDVPVTAIEYLVSAVFPGARVMTKSSWGGWVIWRGFPDLQVFMDSREAAYPLDVVDDYDRFADARLGWEEVLQRYHVDYLLWPAVEFQPRALLATGTWMPLYQDEQAVVLASKHAREPGRVLFRRLRAGMDEDRGNREQSEPSGLKTLDGLLEDDTSEGEDEFGLFRPNRSGPTE